MPERVAFVNGEFVPESRASVSIFDRGLRWGDAVYDVQRTFGHVTFELSAHMDRLFRTFRYARIRPPLERAALQAKLEEMVKRNRDLYAPGDDFCLCEIVTRGTLQKPDQPNFVMYCEDLPWPALAAHYDGGVRLLTASTRRVPAQSLSPNAKTSNKMSQFVALHEVRAADADAYPLMLDIYGNIAETHSHNFFFVSGGVLRTPTLANCLPGISRAVTLRLARAEGIPVEEGAYTVFDVYNGEEAFITSTSCCLLGVTHLDGLPIGNAFPGPITQRLIAAWTRAVGLDFMAQARARAGGAT